MGHLLSCVVKGRDICKYVFKNVEAGINVDCGIIAKNVEAGINVEGGKIIDVEGGQNMWRVEIYFCTVAKRIENICPRNE